MKVMSICAALFFATPALAVESAPSMPTSQEMRMIEAELARAMPFEGRVLTGNVVVGKGDGNTGRFVCGNVLSPGDDPTHPAKTPFMGILGQGVQSQEWFFLLVKVATVEPGSADAVAKACLDRL